MPQRRSLHGRYRLVRLRLCRYWVLRTDLRLFTRPVAERRAVPVRGRPGLSVCTHFAEQLLLLRGRSGGHRSGSLPRFMPERLRPHLRRLLCVSSPQTPSSTSLWVCVAAFMSPCSLIFSFTSHLPHTSSQFPCHRYSSFRTECCDDIMSMCSQGIAHA